MILRRFILTIGVVAVVFGLLAWLAGWPAGRPETMPVTSGARPVRFRLGLIPERNLYEQRKALRALGDYLEAHVHVGRGKSTLDAGPALHVELVTSSNYAGILKDFAEGDVDGAFLGSLVTVLAVDRYGARVLAKSENPAGLDTYAGVLFVAEDSSIKSLGDLRGKKLGAVRTTMAGSVYPLFAFERAGMEATARPEMVWSGTHDDVIEEVLAGRVDAGAVKDLRLDAYERGHPGLRFRRLASGPRAPDNAFVVRGNLAPEARDAILATLLTMQQDGQARPVLDGMQVKRFVGCDLSEYAGLYDMIEALGAGWGAVGMDGPAPRRPKWAGRKAGE